VGSVALHQIPGCALRALQDSMHQGTELLLISLHACAPSPDDGRRLSGTCKPTFNRTLMMGRKQLIPYSSAYANQIGTHDVQTGLCPS
jgi:hypothetical protein